MDSFLPPSYNVSKSKYYHCVKSVRIRSYSDPHLSGFGLNTERYSISPRIESECGKMWTRINPNADTFYAVYPSPESKDIFSVWCLNV